MDFLSELSQGGNGFSIYYKGEDDIINLPTRTDLIKDDKITTVINNYIENNQTLFFMPIDINEDNRDRYILKIFGVLMNGSKVEVNITNIEVFFDVLVPKYISSDKIQNDLNTVLRDLELSYHIEDIYAFPLHGFHTEKQLFKRIYASNAFSRLKLMKVVKEQTGLETYSNDSNNYYRKTARENKFALSDWVSIDKYEHNYGPSKYSPACEHIFTVHKDNYKRITDPKIRALPKIIKDRTLVMTWDIETYSARKVGEVPSAEHDEDVVFMICMTVHWLHEVDALYKICIVDKDTESDTRWTTIICNTEVNILKAMAICWNHFRPDIYIGFNDSGYDWPFIVEKATKHNVLPWMWEKMSAIHSYCNEDNILKRHYNDRRKREIKINAEKTFYSQCLSVPGTISIDCLPCFMKIYPRLETNKFGTLKFYLQDNNLPAKIDLPIITLCKYYETGEFKHMREIAYYCVVDSISVQRLFVKRNIITDYREVSTLAYVSLSDAHYYAGGMRVCNLLCAYAWPNILVNMKPTFHSKSGKYPGAYVFPPDKGMTPNMERLRALRESPNKEQAIANFAKDRPVSCLDFASLYPSLIMTYNLSPEKILITQEEYQKWSATYNLHSINFDMGNTNIQSWSIMHNNKPENMGLFPTILQNLFAKRKEMKGLLKKCSDKKELYELIFSKKSDDYIVVIESIITDFQRDIEELCKPITFIPPGSTIEEETGIRTRRKNNIEEMISIIRTFNPDTLQQDYTDVCFERNCIDKKQNALKIYMNTFYGETGNQLSPFFLLQLAGGVTSAGQTNIKLVAEYAKNHGFNIKYGDSVMPYTPLTIKQGGLITIVTIESLDGEWISYPEFKSEDLDRSDKQQLSLPNTYIWTHNGYALIKRVIRHKTTKKIYRILTNTGLIDVTEDHSLLDEDCNIIKPSDCVIGTKLLHRNNNDNTEDNTDDNTIEVCYMDTQLKAQGFYNILQLNGYHASIDYDISRSDQYILTYSRLRCKDLTSIKKIEVLHEQYTGYVYDIETEYGSFHAGIGNLIVKNTDSLYLTCPNMYFRECDEKYISGEYSREEFYTAMVKITLRVVANFEKEVNIFLEKDNGTKFLKMENEGCNYPCLFLGKKKYFGIQHINEVNFNTKKLYIKGIEVIKQGKSGIEKEIGHTIMRTAVSLTNEMDILDIVKTILSESITSNRWKFEDFIQTSSWKPLKDNKTVQCFMKRMHARHTIELRENELLMKQGKEPKSLLYSPLEPGERFSYVLVKTDTLYDLQGRKLNIKAGDIMEYAHVAQMENLPLDIIYYLVHYVIGICARFINSDAQFMPLNIEKMDDKDIDEYSFKMAKKMLEEYVKTLGGISKQDILNQGKECKMLFKNAIQIYSENVNPYLQPIIKGPLLKGSFTDEDEDEIETIFGLAAKQAVTIYKRMCKTYCHDLCIKCNIDPTTGLDIGSNKPTILYKQIKMAKKGSCYSTIEYELRKTYRTLSLGDIFIQYKTDIMYIINKLKNNEDVDIEISYDLNEFVNLWYNIVGLELSKLQSVQYLEYLNELKYKRTRTTKAPTKKEIEQYTTDIISKQPKIT